MTMPLTTLFDWFVPPAVRGDAALSNRYRGAAKALQVVSTVVFGLFLAYLTVIDQPPAQELGLFAAAIIVPLLGAVLMRLTANIALSLLLTNMGGVLLVTVWSYLSGGILSPAAPWALALVAVWSRFGNRAFVLTAGLFASACMAGLYYATVHDMLPGSMMREDQLTLYGLLSLMSATAVTVAGALASHGERERVKRRVQEARLQAERANRAKSVFLSSMSHELRTPLNAVIGFAEVLAYPEGSTLTPQQHEYVRHILHSGEHLLALISQVLDMSRIESGTFALEPGRVDPVPVIETAVDMLAATAAKEEVSVVTDIDAARGCTLWTDGPRLREVVWNLLSNAIKFNHAGGNAQVWARRVEGGLRIGVTDTGRGIPVERQTEVFQAFARLGVEGSTIQGAGLGLVLSRRIVEMMGGSTGFSSTPGAGSDFWIELPLPAEPGPESADRPKPLVDKGFG